MDFNLRLLTDQDLPGMQQVYDLCPDRFRDLTGQPAGPDQAARDFVEGLQMPGRYQFGVFIDEAISGLVDCKLDDAVEGKAHIGLLLLAPPFDERQIAELVLRILIRWLVDSFSVHRLETSVLAHRRELVDFWMTAGFSITGDQFRREFPGYSPRFLILARDLAPDPLRP